MYVFAVKSLSVVTLMKTVISKHWFVFTNKGMIFDFFCWGLSINTNQQTDNSGGENHVQSQALLRNKHQK